jgi:hypothetical protein
MPADDAELVKAGVEGAMSAAMKPFSDLIQALFGPAASGVGLILRDQVDYYKFKNRLRLLQLTTDVLKKAQINPQQVPFKLLGPIIENASVEDEDDLQNRWANLLANAADGRDKNRVAPSFPAILKEFSGRDVKFLEALFLEACEKCARLHWQKTVDEIKFSDQALLAVYSAAGLARFPSRQRLTVAEAGREDAQADARDIGFSMDMFARHGVVVKVFEVPVKRGNTNTFTLGTDYSFTHLGDCFVRACREPNAPLPNVSGASG